MVGALFIGLSLKVVTPMENSFLAPVVLLCLWTLCQGSVRSDVLPYKAVNLGGWLVVEGWMKPTLFEGVPNKDLLDGTQVQFQSMKLKKYISAENGGGSLVVANRSSASGWETFRLWRIDESTFNLRVFNKKFVGLDRAGSRNQAVALSANPTKYESFQIVRESHGSKRVRIKASNGKFLQAKTETLVTADYEGNGWGKDDPSVFTMSIVYGLQGEFQLTNGYGPSKAEKVLRDHWRSFITERDFKFISQHKLNAVRIAVGWWIASGSNPPKPFVAGSLPALDEAFDWAAKYNIRIIIDLHGAEGSQNGLEHSGARDGYTEWGASKIENTVAVIKFLASRYANRTSFGAISLLNEPRSDAISLETLLRYYKAGYDAVRKHSSSAYVILSNRLGDGVESSELLPFATSLTNVAIDVHYYNLFSDMFNRMTIQENIDYVYLNRSSDLHNISAHGSLTFVGEWTGALALPNATKQDFLRYTGAQMEVYANATFGWAYWSYKCFLKHWSLEWMIQNRYIIL